MKSPVCRVALLLFATAAALLPAPAQAQENSIVIFEDDFSSDTIDPERYQPETPFFEGGQGDIHAEAGDGVIRFVGTTTQQWWSGSVLRVLPAFDVSKGEPVTFSIDRVAEAGVGTASRSALWIMDESLTSYVLFADVRAEGGWSYNRKIGEPGDVPTGGGTVIPAFDPMEDGGQHRMSVVANGETVKLLLDGIEGAEVRFPFSPVVFAFGAFARATGDTADTTWDNLRIERSGSASFVNEAVTVRQGQFSPDITVRIPEGWNAEEDIEITVTSENPDVAEPEGGTEGTLTLNFVAGGPNTLTFRAEGIGQGGTVFTLGGDLPGANELSVAVISAPGVVLEENFEGDSLDTSLWEISERGFESGTGQFTVTQAGGVLDITGYTDVDYWPGASIKTVQSFIATPELNLVFEMDRDLMDMAGTAARTGVYITTDDRSRYVFFGQNYLESYWQVNVNPGNPTGSGTALTSFGEEVNQDLGERRLRLVADGETVEVFVDGVSGGRFPFAVRTGIHFEIGAYARAVGDYVQGIFDNVRIENVLPCAVLTPANVTMTLGESGREGTVTIPQLLNDTQEVTVTIRSEDPDVAIPTGAVNGVLELTFPAGESNTRTFGITAVGKGSTIFTIETEPETCVTGTLTVDVFATPLVLLADDFSGNSIDTTKWEIDTTPFDPTGVATAESEARIVNGMVEIDVTVEFPLWPGIALMSVDEFSAAETEPLTFEVDRVAVDFVLTTGTDAEQRTGAWIREPNGGFILFAEHLDHNGRNFGWTYNRMIGGVNDNPLDDGITIPAFSGPAFADRGLHRMKMVANGSTVRLYLDDVLGVELDFPFSEGLRVGFGTYSDDTGNVAIGRFDNVRVLGGEDTNPPTELTVARDGAQIVISWTGEGTLQQSTSLGPEADWTDVTPQPTGGSHTVDAGSAEGAMFFRLAR